MIKLYGYCDESGNTGLDITDENQPYFWLAALVSRHDLKGTSTAAVHNMAKKIGVEELHFNKLGLSKITEISGDLLRVYRKNNCYMFFIRIEKLHFAKMKLISFIFDSDNPAVSPIHHQLDVFRNSMAINMCNCISTHLVKDFWKLFITGDMEGISDILLILKKDVSASVVTDDRSKELIVDMIDYAVHHTDQLFWKATKDDSPNAHALIMLTNAINVHYSGKTVVIEKFYHDRQNQFQSALMNQFQYTKNLLKINTSSGSMLDMKNAGNFKCELTIADSKANCGLQMVDILLGIVKGAIDKKTQYHGALAKLHKHCTKQAVIAQYTYSDLAELVIEMDSQIPMLSPEGADRGRKMIEDLEKARKANLVQALDEEKQ